MMFPTLASLWIITIVFPTSWSFFHPMSLWTILACYRGNYRLGKAQSNPQDDDNGGRVYPLSPHINPPLLMWMKNLTQGGVLSEPRGKQDGKWYLWKDAPVG
jgi:hypothetical protein